MLTHLFMRYYCLVSGICDQKIFFCIGVSGMLTHLFIRCIEVLKNIYVLYHQDMINNLFEARADLEL